MNWNVELSRIVRYVKIGFCTMMSLMIMMSYWPMTAHSGHRPGVYYVAVDGDDQNDGTFDSPWRTLQTSVERLRPGDTLLIRGGIYEEFLTIRNSGTAQGGYITIQSYPGEQAIIDGTNLTMGSGNSALVHLRGVHYLIFADIEIRNLRTSSSSDYPSGIKIQGGGSNIHILNNNVHHIENHGSRGNANGILVYGDSRLPIKNVVISGNQVHHLINGSSESVTVVGNVDGFRVDHNIIHDNQNIGIDIAGFYETCDQPCIDQARNGFVAFNKVYNIDASVNPRYYSRNAGGIYIDGGTKIIVENNEVYNSNFGIELASEKEGHATSYIIVRNNYIHHNHGAGLLMGGSSLENGGATRNLITNNTLYMNDTTDQGYGEITFQHHVSHNVFVNNLIYSAPDKSFIRKSNTSGGRNRLDYNLYYRQGDSSSTPWRYDGVSYKTWDEYRQATGFDQHSIYADPLIHSMDDRQVMLSPDSPAIDAGTVQYGEYSQVDYYRSHRIEGDNIDIGAAEFTEKDDPLDTEVRDLPLAKAQPELDSAPPKPIPAPGPFQDIEEPLFDAPIRVDGSSEDWEGVPNLATGDSNVKSLRSFIQNDILYVLVTGERLHEKSQLYIHVDAAGRHFASGYWQQGAQYLIEKGHLYQYSGLGGQDWKWSALKSYTRTEKYLALPSMIEYAIPLSDLQTDANASISIGFLWNDSSSHRLPLRGEMAVAKQMPFDSMAAPDSEVSGTEDDFIVIDGRTEDWKEIQPIAYGQGRIQSVRLTHDERFMYLLIEGQGLDGKLQMYLNTDNQNSGYNTSKWDAPGVDNLLESGRIYRYIGDGKQWSFEESINLKNLHWYVSQPTVIEAALPLEHLLPLNEEGIIRFGLVLNDNKADKLPTDGHMLTYSLK